MLITIALLAVALLGMTVREMFLFRDLHKSNQVMRESMNSLLAYLAASNVKSDRARTVVANNLSLQDAARVKQMVRRLEEEDAEAADAAKKEQEPPAPGVSMTYSMPGATGRL